MPTRTTNVQEFVRHFCSPYASPCKPATPPSLSRKRCRDSLSNLVPSSKREKRRGCQSSAARPSKIMWATSDWRGMAHRARPACRCLLSDCLLFGVFLLETSQGVKLIHRASHSRGGDGFLNRNGSNGVFHEEWCLCKNSDEDAARKNNADIITLANIVACGIAVAPPSHKISPLELPPRPMQRNQSGNPLWTSDRPGRHPLMVPCGRRMQIVSRATTKSRAASPSAPSLSRPITPNQIKPNQTFWGFGVKQ